VLLTAILASAGYVFFFQRNHQRSPAEALSPLTATNNGDQTPSPQPAANDDQANALKKQLEEAQAQNEKLEKKLADEEKKKSELREHPEQTHSTVSPPAGAAPTPSAPTPTTSAPAQIETAPMAGEACLTVAVSGPNGETAAQLPVVIDQIGDGRSMMFKGRTNQKGLVHRCGLAPGSQVRVAVFGPRGGVLGTKATTLASGRNFVDITVLAPAMLQRRDNDPQLKQPRDDEFRLRPRRKRPPF
jgi:hypothetical protein